MSMGSILANSVGLCWWETYAGVGWLAVRQRDDLYFSDDAKLAGAIFGRTYNWRAAGILAASDESRLSANRAGQYGDKLGRERFAQTKEVVKKHNFARIQIRNQWI